MRAALLAARPCSDVMTLSLLSADPLQCRFMVKNDVKVTNQKLAFVQANGYVGYKARYFRRKRRMQSYGLFRLRFEKPDAVIFPLIREPSEAATEPEQGASATATTAAAALLLCRSGGVETPSYSATAPMAPFMTVADARIANVAEVIITVRLFQPTRGLFPVRRAGANLWSGRDHVVAFFLPVA